MKNKVKKTAIFAGKVLRVSLGIGLILADVAATAVGAILCAVSSQN